MKAAAIFWYAIHTPMWWWKISLKKWTANSLLHASHLHQGSHTAIACYFTYQWCIPTKYILGNIHSNNTNSRTTFLATEKHLLPIQKVSAHLPRGSWGKSSSGVTAGLKNLMTIMFTMFLPHKVGQIWLQNKSMLEVYFNNRHVVFNKRLFWECQASPALHTAAMLQT